MEMDENERAESPHLLCHHVREKRGSVYSDEVGVYNYLFLSA